MTHRMILASSLFLGLVACSTPEFQAERSSCTATWMSNIPPRLEREIYNETRTRQVPTGQTTCVTTGNIVTCNQVMRTEFYTVPAVRTVDRNKPRRDAQIDDCTRRACLARFGNAECKPA
jgi:hypothetical protein